MILQDLIAHKSFRFASVLGTLSLSVVPFWRVRGGPIGSYSSEVPSFYYPWGFTVASNAEALPNPATQRPCSITLEGGRVLDRFTYG